MRRGSWWPWIVSALVAGAAALLARRNQIDAELTSLLPHDAPAAQAMARYTRAFAREELLVVLVEGDAPAEVATAAGALAARLAAHPDVRAARDRVGGDVLAYLRASALVLLDDAEWSQLVERAADARTGRRLRALINSPAGSAAAERLAGDPLGALELLGRRLGNSARVDVESGRFASADGRAALVLVEPARPARDLAADQRLLERVRALAAELPRVRVAATGAPAYRLAYERTMKRDLALSSTASLCGVLVLFGLFFRSLRILPLVALALVLSYLATLGLWGALSGHIGALSLAFGGLLLGIGVDVPIQLWSRIREQLTDTEPELAVTRAVRALAGVSVVATLGPAVVFGACALSRFRALRELGALAGLGLCVNAAIMLLLLPALLRAGTRLWARVPRAARGETHLERLGAACARRHRLVLGATGALVALCGFLAHLRLAPHPLAFEASLEPTQVEDRVEARFGARRGRLIALAEAVSLEEALAKNDRITEAVRKLAPASLQTLSDLVPAPATQARRAARVRARADELRRQLAQTLEAAGLRPQAFPLALDALAPATADGLERAGLSFVVSAHVAPTEGGWMVACYVTPRAADQVPALAAAIAGAGGAASGAPLIERAIARVLPGDLVRVTAISIGAVALLLLAYYRRPRPVVYVLAPLGAAWVAFAALAPPLSLWNLIALPLVVGYGIDDHVFVVGRALEGGGAGRALRLAGRAVVLTSLATLAGFASLLLASFAGIRSLGAAGALSVGLCFAAAMIVLPALLGLRADVSAQTRDADHGALS